VSANQYCTFVVGGVDFGIGVREVQEVIRYQPMTRVPLVSPTVSGLINLRGQLVTAIDLRRRLDMPERPEGQLPMNVVVHRDDGAVSLLVDEIGDVVEVDDDTMQRAPETLRPPARDLITGVHMLEDHLLLILATDRAVDVDG
jgi:purine-binding chemotaxis protein CheW